MRRFKRCNPYQQPDVESGLPEHCGNGDARRSSLTPLVASLAVAALGGVRWWLPVLYGGEPYTFGLLGDELFVVFVVGFVIGCQCRQWLLLYPSIYFFVAYGVHAPFLQPGKFEALYWLLGGLAFFAMLMGEFLGGPLLVRKR